MTRIKSPLRYPGGKSKAVKAISKYLPQNFDEYREPFAGGASVFLYMKQENMTTNSSKEYWINDGYPLLANFWKQCQRHGEDLVELIKMWKTMYRDGRSLYKQVKGQLELGLFNEVQEAAAFFIMNRITFSGTTFSGGYSEQCYQKRFTDSSIDRVEAVLPLLQDNVTITNFDYSTMLAAPSKPGSKVFIFLDPPYFSNKESKLYGDHGHLHSEFDHDRLADSLKQCPNPFLMTYDDCEEIRDLYSWANIIPWELNYSANKKKKGKELFILNDQAMELNSWDSNIEIAIA